ncbi:Mg-chelatase subunit ChlD [Photobacterium marinum]|uniref:Mg-chelatase subunit ChlD n=1 Tax=Photobacterium marinum TaxID=1056511 RepID=L8JDJ9_9GAMM|nr:VWA domain-containing protein [Photobacterium marinum]ELR66895.1 Mg-chelatase subunit ChlD [Photobacterium marinum]
MNNHELSRRWRLILGSRFPQTLGEDDTRKDECLDELYDREYQARVPWHHIGGRHSGSPCPVDWLHKVRRAFPKATADILQRHGLDHYGLTELLMDEELLRQQKPDMALLQTLLAFKDKLPESLSPEIERIISTVCEELEQVLSQPVRSMFSRQRIPLTQARPMPLSYTDWQRTITRNLKHYQPEDDTFILERPFFYQTQHNQIPWDIYLVIDQSGSMLSALIHASVIAAIFCRLPMLNIRLYLFDTRVVDFTEQADSPLNVLLNVQMGGGTDIGSALAFTHSQIEHPQRSIVVLVSDFAEGGSPQPLYQTVDKMQQDGITLLGLTALDQQGNAQYNNHVTEHLLVKGMPIASMTPENLSQWIAEVIKK